MRSHVSLIQTIGRAARNLEGRVILYADQKTDSILKAIEETTRRRIKQINYNKINKIIPKSTSRKIEDILPYVDIKNNKKENNKTLNLDDLKKKMIKLAENLEFEKAAEIRDQIQSLEKTVRNK